ncbi:MAG TPA: hypothetical protein VIH67_04865 [Candidatus Acidoferrum sp.]
MSHDSEQQKKSANPSRFSAVRPVTDADGPRVNALLFRAFGLEVDASDSQPPEKNSLGVVIESPDGEIEMAYLGHRAVFAVLTLLADPTKLQSDAMAENLKLLLEQAERELRGAHVDGIMLMLPFPLASLIEKLKGMGFVSESSLAICWKNFSSDQRSSSSSKPS